MRQRNQATEIGATDGKGFGAVERIDDPLILGIGIRVAFFLADDAVFGAVLGQIRALGLFDFLVRQGHGRFVVFVFDGQSRATEIV